MVVNGGGGRGGRGGGGVCFASWPLPVFLSHLSLFSSFLSPRNQSS